MTAVVTIRGKKERERLHRWVEGVPDLTRVVFHEPKRSLPQNDRYWACMTDIARQCEYHGLKLPKEDWSQLFLDALDRDSRLVPNLDGTGFVNLRHSSSQLGHARFSDLLEIVMEWGTRNGVTWSDKPDE